MTQTSSVGEARMPEVHERQHWVSPADLLAQIDFQEGTTVADIRAGTGYFAIPIGHEVGPSGKVFAVELRRVLLDQLRSSLRAPGAPCNIAPTEGSATRTNLPDASCDIVLLADVWHELEDKEAALREARRILREGGRLVILDWRHDAASPPGPPPERRIPMQEVICSLELNSWSLDKAREIGRNGYLLVVQPADESVQS